MLFNSKEEKNPDKVDQILKLADDYAIKNEDIFYCMEEKMFYEWKDDYWQFLEDLEFERRLIEEERMTYLSLKKLHEFMKRVASLKYKKRSELNNHDVLDLRNGIFDVKHGQLVSHEKKYYSTVRIPYNYDPSAVCPAWEAFLNSSLENDLERINVIQEFIGYCLGRDNKFQKALFLLGEPASGKGTILRAIQRLVGEHNYSSLSLGALGDKAARADLINKIVNIDADVSIESKYFESDFNKVTGKDSVMVKVLYKNEFKYTPFCKLICAANELPRISDKTRGVFRRMIVVPFNKSFEGKEDRGLEDKLIAEIPGILNWAIKGRMRLYEKGDFSVSSNLRDVVNEIKRENNPIEHFVFECIGKDVERDVSKKEVYEYYKEWCTENGNKPLSHIKFSKEFYRVCKDFTVKDGKSTGKYGNYHTWPWIYIKGKHEVQTVGEWSE
jgi:putative DNA primase/helicase